MFDEDSYLRQDLPVRRMAKVSLGLIIPNSVVDRCELNETDVVSVFIPKSKRMLAEDAERRATS